MAGGGKGNMERVRRGFRTVFFMLTMVASLLLLSAPVAVAVGDVSVSLALASKFACARCYGLREHLRRYGFRSSLMDIPVVSILRSLIITCEILSPKFYIKSFSYALIFLSMDFDFEYFFPFFMFCLTSLFDHVC